MYTLFSRFVNNMFQRFNNAIKVLRWFFRYRSLLCHFEYTIFKCFNNQIKSLRWFFCVFFDLETHLPCTYSIRTCARPLRPRPRTCAASARITSATASIANRFDFWLTIKTRRNTYGQKKFHAKKCT